MQKLTTLLGSLLLLFALTLTSYILRYLPTKPFLKYSHGGPGIGMINRFDSNFLKVIENFIISPTFSIRMPLSKAMENKNVVSGSAEVFWHEPLALNQLFSWAVGRSQKMDYFLS